MTHPFLARLRSPLHIAHRGGAALYPENTLYAFEQAVRVHRTDMLELDLHATADGEVVVAHDATLERCTDGAGPIAAMPWHEVERLDAAFHFTPLGETGTPLRGRGLRIPRFVDVLRAFPGLPINVELKAPGVLEPLAALLAKEDWVSRLCIGAEDDALAARIAERFPDACRFFPRDALAAFVLGSKGGDVVDDDRYLVLDMPYRWEGVTLFDAELAAVAAARGKWINVWTVDEEADMRQALADGVGGIMTDRPDRLRAVLDAARR
jgi:glycerophosphoryl diester phosphodiesterase